MQPDGIGVPTNKLIHVQSIDYRRALHALLFAANEDGHVFLATSLLLGFLGGSELALLLVHERYTCFCSQQTVQIADGKKQRKKLASVVDVRVNLPC